MEQYNDVTRDDQALLGIANELLNALHIGRRVKKISDIDAAFFTLLYEGVCGEPLKDVVRDVRTTEDEAHNCQAVIDSLSFDVINVPLSHITGQDIVAGDRTALGDLLEIFSGLMEYLLEEINSATGTDCVVLSDVDVSGSPDPDKLNVDIVDNALHRHLYNRPQHLESSMERMSLDASCSPIIEQQGSASFEQHISRVPMPKAVEPVLSVPVSLAPRRTVAAAATPHYANTSSSRFAAVSSHMASSSSQLTTARSLSVSVGGSSLTTTSCPSSVSVGGHSLTTTSRTSSATFVSAAGSKSFLATEPRIVSTGVTVSSSSVAGKSTSAAEPPLTSAALNDMLNAARSKSVELRLSSSTFNGSSSSARENSLLSGEPQMTSSSLDGSMFSAGSRPSLISEPRLPSTPFDTVGMRSTRIMNNDERVKPGNVSKYGEKDINNGFSASLLNERNSFTHHLYHHHDDLSNRAGTLCSDKLEMSGTAPLSDRLSSSFRDIPSSASHKPQEVRNGLLTSSHLARGDFNDLSSSLDQRHSTEMPQLSRQHALDASLSENLVGKQRMNYGVEGRTNLRSATSAPLLSTGKTAAQEKQKRNVRFEVSRAPRNTYPSAAPNRSERESSSEEPHEAFPSSTFPRTYQEYLHKYYGSDLRRPGSQSADEDDEDEDASYFSDGCVDYLDNDIVTDKTVSSHDLSNSFERELEMFKERLKRKARVVRFEDHLDNSARGQIGELRRQLKVEDQKSRMKKEFLRKVYGDDLSAIVDQSEAELSSVSKIAKEKEALYKKMVLKKPKTAQYKGDKYSKPVSVLTGKPRARAVQQQTTRDRKRSASASPDASSGSRDKYIDRDLFPWLLEEFPYLHLAPATLHNLWLKESLQLEQLSRTEAETKRKKSKAQEQVEEAERRQKLLVDIINKEHLHRQRLKEARGRQQLQVSTRNKLRDKRLQTTRVRKYYEEYQVRQRSRMLKKQTKEELVFKKLFDDGLTIQKQRIRDLRNYAKEQREERAKRQKLELEALENYYKDQFALLSESMERERKDINTREKAQTKVLEQMKRELRTKMEKEIEDLQKRMWEDDDDIYYRELDAERLRRHLNVARCQTKV